MNIILYNIAEYSHFILIIISLFLLWNNNTLLYYYIIGVSLNELINILLKILIKQDRPNTKKNNNTNEKDNENDNNKSDITDIANNDKNKLLSSNVQMYGMPSGHAQSVSFSTMFIYLSLHNIYLTSFFIIISSISIFQRVYLKFHTIEQVIVGVLVGSFLSYLFYKLALKNYFPIIFKYKFLLLLFPISFIHVF